MGRKREMADKDTLVNLYVDQKLSASVIAKQLQVSRQLLRNWFAHYNIPMRTVSEEAKIQRERHPDLFKAKLFQDKTSERYKNFCQTISQKAKERYANGQIVNCKIYDIPPKEDIEYLYIERGLSANTVAKMFDTTIPTLRKWIKQYDIQYKDISKSLRDLNSRHLIYNSFRDPVVQQKCQENRTVYRRSKSEIELYEWIKQYCPDAVHSYMLANRSFDICIPSKYLLIEYQGLFWHSEAFYYTGQNHNNKTLRDIKWMHKEKKDIATQHGYRLFQVWEDDWAKRPKVIKEFILTILNINKERVFARKCKVVGVPRLRTDEFIERFHIQGSMSRYSCSIGLAYNNELIAVMAFAKEPDGTMNLARYAVDSRFQIIGGFAKLLAWFIKKYPGKKVITFADLSYVDELSNVYIRNGFKPIQVLNPDYKYIVGGERRHKFSFRRSYLERTLGDKFNPTLSEYQNCINNEIYRAWDTGKIKYELV